MIFFAIPFFKNVAFLQDTLNSLLYQTSPNWSAVVLDDSIDDLEAKKAERYIKKLADHSMAYGLLSLPFIEKISSVVLILCNGG